MKSITQPIQLTLPFDGKVCTICGQWMPLAEYHFEKRRNRLAAHCKACHRAMMQAWYTRNREQLLEKHRQWWADNPDYGKDRWAAQTFADKAHKRERQRIYRRINSTAMNIRERARYHADPSRSAKASRKWRSKNIDKYREYFHRRRARIAQNGGTYTAQQWQELKAKYNSACLACGRTEPTIKLTVDHVLPIVKGGTNDISNIQPLCFSCNDSKGVKHIDYR